MFRVMVDSPISSALKVILGRIENAMKRRPPEFGSHCPQLVAVSKTKPADLVIEAYKCGQRHFGENYVQEIVQKGSQPEVLELKDIKWHFIGHLQRNKCNNLTAVPNLYMVQTIDTAKLATALNNSWIKQNKSDQLKVMVQVNTSGEENKSGCPPDCSIELVQHIMDKCPGLCFAGVMTIGALARSVQQGDENEDFKLLLACRKEICEKLSLPVENVQLSMGMSADFEHAFCVRPWTEDLNKTKLKNFCPAPDPKGLPSTASEVCRMGFPFSRHDNRDALQGHGIYFETGSTKKLLPEKKYKCSEDSFLPDVLAKPAYSCYSESYKKPDTKTTRLQHTRYPHEHLTRSSHTQRQYSSTKSNILTSFDLLLPKNPF